VKLLDEGFGILSGLQSFTVVHFLSVAFGVVILRRRRSVVVVVHRKLYCIDGLSLSVNVDCGGVRL